MSLPIVRDYCRTNGSEYINPFGTRDFFLMWKCQKNSAPVRAVPGRNRKA